MWNSTFFGKDRPSPIKRSPTPREDQKKQVVFKRAVVEKVSTAPHVLVCWGVLLMLMPWVVVQGTGASYYHNTYAHVWKKEPRNFCWRPPKKRARVAAGKRRRAKGPNPDTSDSGTDSNEQRHQRR
jgi:hypothetical protein